MFLKILVTSPCNKLYFILFYCNFFNTVTTLRSLLNHVTYLLLISNVT
jgi:hypothetical protein